MLKELNQVMDYIETHLRDDLSLEEISEYAGVSDYHFRKIFYYIAGTPLSEYIMNRKLSEANNDLLNGESVTDTAFKYGYQSIDGFSRAFRKWSGVLPSEVSNMGMRKVFPKLHFSIHVKGGHNMDYKIIEKPRFKFAGVSKRVPMQFEGVNSAIEEIAHTITKEQKIEMHALQNIEPREIVNVSYEHDFDFMEDDGELTHLIGVLTTEDKISDSLDIMEVEACTWAVFPSEGSFPAVMQDTMARIYSEWLPGSDYVLVDAPNFSFTKMSEVKENHAYNEIWIAVDEK